MGHISAAESLAPWAGTLLRPSFESAVTTDPAVRIEGGRQAGTLLVAKARITSENEMVQPSSSRVTSRDGVNTARLFFERHACRFQEIDQQ
jgi:hypothetical protein